jgi:hypothetical protein
MTAAQIIIMVSTSRDYREVCKNITKGNPLHEDLFQDLIEILLKKDPEYIETIYRDGYLRGYILKILGNQYKSTNSKFYKENKQFSDLTVQNVTTTAYYDEEEIKQTPKGFNISYIPEDIPENQLEEIIKIVEVNKLKDQGDFKEPRDWYKNQVFTMYLKAGSYRKLEAEADSPLKRNTIALTVKEYKQDLLNLIETKRIFMDKSYFKIPAEVKEQIFENAILLNMDPEDLLSKQLQVINRAIKQKSIKKAKARELKK